MDFRSIASRVASFSIEARRKKAKPKVKKVSRPKKVPFTTAPTEYSCQMDITLTADFEGDSNKTQIIKKLKSEVIAALQSGVSVVSRELGIKATNILVKPLNVECSVLDQSSIEEDDDEFYA